MAGRKRKEGREEGTDEWKEEKGKEGRDGWMEGRKRERSQEKIAVRENRKKSRDQRKRQ